MTYFRLGTALVFTIICSCVALLFNLIDRTFSSYFRLTRFFSFSILRITGITLKIEGAHNVPADEPVVFVSNHSSLFDIPAVMASAPRNASIVFKKELARIPLFGWQLITGPFVLIDRQNPERAMKSIEKAKRLMSERKISIVLFAEGTRSKDGTVQSFKRGAFHLAALVNHPIVPVSISGAEKIMPKGKLKLSRGTLRIVFGEPIPTKPNMNKKDELELMEQVREVVIKNREE